MPKMGIKEKDGKALELIEKVIEDTIIIQHQNSLIIGRWDFIIFGELKKKKLLLERSMQNIQLLSQLQFILPLKES